MKGLACADVGSSTGGFTDCLLQRGAAKVYAIDVGKGILHWKLRNDPRVVVMEETNARFVESLPERIDFVTVDASFISLKILLPVVKKWLPNTPIPPSLPGKRGAGGTGLVALIKPQFEAGKKDVSRGDGVIRDPEIHRQVLNDVLGFAQKEGFGIHGLIKSPLLGPKGNAEFLVWLGEQEYGCGCFHACRFCFDKSSNRNTRSGGAKDVRLASVRISSMVMFSCCLSAGW